MEREIHFNKLETQRLYRPMLFALLDGLTKAEGIMGDIMVMDVHNALILSHVALHESSVLKEMSFEERKGKFGEMMFCINEVKNVDFIGVEAKASKGYVERYGLDMLPIEVIMPAVSYLSFAECGFLPSDILEWDSGKATLEDAFVEGIFAPLNSAIMQLCPEGITQLVSWLYNVGLIAIYPNKNPSDLQELLHNELPLYLILDWICQIALDINVIKKSSSNEDESDNTNEVSKSVQMLKNVLEKSGSEGTVKTAACGGSQVAGYTYVTEKNANRNQLICLLGYYPVDTPQYGIMVWFQRCEQLHNAINKDEVELEEIVAGVCKRVVEILTNECTG